MATPMRSTDFRAVVEPILNEVFDGVYQQRDDEWKGFVTALKSVLRIGVAMCYFLSLVIRR